MNDEYSEISARYVDESDADYQSRVEEERLRQEQLDADPAAHIDWANADAEERFRARMEPPPAPMDFISTYADWADVAEAPRTVHEAIAIQLVAATLNRRGVFIDWGYPLSMDLWMGIIAESGIGKNTSMGPARDILRAASIPDLIHSVDPGSKEKLYEILSGGPPPEVDKAGNVRVPDISEYVRSRFYAWTGSYPIT